MRTLHNAPIEAVLVGIVGLATVAVVVSSRAHAADVINALGTGFSRLLAAAISPIMGSSGLAASGLPGFSSTGLQGFSGSGSAGTGSLVGLGAAANMTGFTVAPGSVSGAASAAGSGSSASDFLLTPAASAPDSQFANEVPYDNAGLYIDGGQAGYAGAEITVSGAR